MPFLLQLRVGDFPKQLRDSLAPSEATADTPLQLFVCHRCIRRGECDPVARWIQPTVGEGLQQPPARSSRRITAQLRRHYSLTSEDELSLTAWCEHEDAPDPLCYVHHCLTHDGVQRSDTELEDASRVMMAELSTHHSPRALHRTLAGSKLSGFPVWLGRRSVELPHLR
jgi:hypothetical protein